MKLESLQLDKFQDKALKKEQMFKLNGGGTKTEGGFGCGTGTLGSNPNAVLAFNFGYDVDRGGGRITYHDRTNVREISAAECNAMLNL
jgi:natural product precursor